MKKRKTDMSAEHKLSSVSFIDPDSGVDFHWCYQNSTSYHDHDYYEFIIITDGKIQHMYNDKIYTSQRGRVFLIKPAEYHRFLPKNNLPAKQINFSITPQALKSLSSAVWQNDIYKKLNDSVIPANVSLSEKTLAFILNTVERINQCPSHSQNIFAYIKTIIVELIIALTDKLDLADNLCSESSSVPNWLTEFLGILSQPEYFTMKLKDIYPLAPYSQSALNTYFNKYVGMTIIEYITKSKISYACNLLRYTDDSPLDISGKLAYDSLSHFNRIFKKFTGRTPIAYRKEYAFSK